MKQYFKKKKFFVYFNLNMIKWLVFSALLAFAMIIPTLILIWTSKQDIHLHEGQREYEGSSGKIEDKPKALNSLQKFLKSFKEGNEDGLLYIVRLYCFGLHPEFAPSKIIGMRLINRVAIDSRFSEKLKKSCKVIFEDASIMAYEDMDAVNDNYDTLPDNIIEIIESIIDHQLKNNVTLKVCTTNVTHTTVYEDEEINNDEILINTVRNLPVNVTIHNDSQNVHNHSVGNTCVKIIEQLSERKVITKSFEETVHHFLKQVDDIVDENILQRVIYVLDSFTADIHSKFLQSEQDIFVLVYNRIMYFEGDKRQNLLKILIDNLQSSIEYDAVVCSTGKITRMLSIFDAVDDELTDIKPDWALKEEISNMAIKIRENTLKNLSAKEIKAYNAGDRDDVSTNMKDRLIEECSNIYVESNILSQTALDLLLQDYLEAF